MSGRRLLIFGAGHLGRQVVHHLVHHADAEILGFVDDTKAPGEEIKDGLRTVGGLDQVRESAEFGPERAFVVFAIGYADMRARALALERVKRAGYTLESFIHPRAVVEPGARVGAGSIVLAAAVVDQGVSIGEGCYVDIGVRLGEDSVVGANNYFSSGAAIGGSVVVGSDNFWGMDCTATTGVKVGSRCFINAKTLVSRDVGDEVKLVELHKSRELPN